MLKNKLFLLLLIFLAILSVSGCKRERVHPYDPVNPNKNNPPDAPARATGLSKGRTEVLYSYTSYTLDHENDSVAIRFDWGNGDTSVWSAWVRSNKKVSMDYSWGSGKTYTVKVQAKDIHGSLSEWSFGFNVKISDNTSPNTPSIIANFSTGDINAVYNFSAYSEDPEQDSISIKFDWGDGDTSGWSPWMASKDTLKLSHSWTSLGQYQVKVQAKDIREALSNWSFKTMLICSTWVKVFGSSANENANCIRETWDGGYIIVGEKIYEVWLIKTDTDGNIIWDKFFGGSYDDGNFVQQTTDGGYIIVGSTGSYGVNGSIDVWLIRTDANGNELWNKNYGGYIRDYGYSGQQTYDGGYILTGRTESYGVSLGDAWLIKTDAEGNKIWDKTFGAYGSDYMRSVQQTSDGGYILCGTISYGGSEQNGWLIKTDANGNKMWEKIFYTGSSNSGYSVQQTLDGGYILFGTNLFIKTDAYGNELWNKPFSGTGLDGQQTSDGGYVLLGYQRIVKTDFNGNLEWDKTFDNGYLHSVRQTLAGNYIIAGYTYINGNRDILLVKIILR